MKKNSDAGFTLVELLVTLAIATIVLGLAVPSFDMMVKNNRQVGQVNELVTAFNIARSEAVKRNLPMSICASSDGSSCGGDWHQGWLVFADGDGDGVVEDSDTTADFNGDGAINRQDAILRTYAALDGDNTITSSGATAVTFNSRGQSPNAGDQLLFCDRGGDADAVAVLISATGRVNSVDKVDNGSVNPAVTVSCPS